MMKISKVIIAMLFAMVMCSLGNVQAVTPGIQSGISTKAVQKLLNKVFPPVLNAIKTTKYEDISDIQKKSKTYIYHPTFHALTVGSFIAQVNGNQFTVGIKDLYLDLKAGWRVKKKKIFWFSTHGNVEVRFAASKILASFKFGTKAVGANLKPTFAVSNVSVDVTTAKVKLSRNIFAWLFNMVLSFFKGKIRTIVNKAIRDALQTGLTGAANKMSDAIGTVGKLGAIGTINLGLTSGIQLLKNDVIALPFNGEITSTKGIVGTATRHNIPFVPTGRMLDLFIDTYVINSGASAVFKSSSGSALNVFAPTSARPTGFTVDLIGNSLGLDAINTAGYSKNLLRITTVPVSALSVASAVSNLSAAKVFDLVFDLNLGNGRYLEAIVIRCTASGGVNVVFEKINNNPMMTPKITSLKATFQQVRSAFGNVTMNKLNKLLDEILNKVVVPGINTTILQPIPIPTTTGLTLANPSIVFKQDHVYAGFDVDFVL